MRRGRTALVIVLVIVLVAIGGFFAYRIFISGSTANAPTATPGIRYVDIVTAGQNITPGIQITDDMLSTLQIPEDKKIAGEFTNKAEVVGQFAKIQIAQGVPLVDSMLSVTPGNVNLPGSSWAPLIPQGLTAVSIPITRLSSTSYGIRDGDYVNIIVTMLLVDVDASYQTILPNNSATIIGPGALQQQLPMLTVQIASGGDASAQGRTEMDPTLNSAIYLVPSEVQRPRMVTQMIMQNVQVLHVGTFPLPGEQVTEQLSAGATPTPNAQGQTTTQIQITRPDVITLMVTPQDAVVLTNLIYNGSQITLTLRNPNDFDFRTTTDAATLQYLLSQYNIPVPAKLPYATQPRIDVLTAPSLPNDVIVVPAQ
jgi:Flp pilus assembly protein CpaB